MRCFTSFFFLLLPLVSLSQQIHDIKVSPVNIDGPTLQQVRDEFWQYHLLATTTNQVWYGNDYISSTFGLTWPNPMLVWDEHGNDMVWGPDCEPETRYTAAISISYSKAWRSETDPSRKQIYQEYALKSAEYLLCLQQSVTHDGGVPDFPIERTLPPPFNNHYLPISHGYGTGVSIVAFLEAYLSFGDQRFLQAAINGAEWQMSHPSYPYGDICPTCDCPSLPPGNSDSTYPCTYYSNANHIAQQLWSLASVYSITGEQRYLDRCLQASEEIMAWQDYIDVQNIWPAGSIPDGGWYWYDYGANPVPPGSPNPPPNGGGPNQNRMMLYHNLIIRALLTVLDAVGQQSLPGVTTIRNNSSFVTFRTNLINSIVKAFNYMVDNQEDCVSCQGGQYRGGLRHYKNNSQWYDGGIFGTNRTTAPPVLEALSYAYEFITRYDKDISSSDLYKIQSLLSSVAENMRTKYTGNYIFTHWSQVAFPGWGRYLNFKDTAPPVPVLNLKNNGFEDNIIVWELWSWDGGGVDITNQLPRSGQKSVHIVDNSTSASKWASQIVTASANKQYTLKAFARIMSGHQDLKIDFLDNQFNGIQTYVQIVYPNTGFSEVSLTQTAPANTAYIRIWLYSYWAGTSEGYWDDVSLTESASGIISSNTTWSGNINVVGTVTVNAGITLTIIPGTNILFSNGTSLIVNGVLNANGTLSQRIVFGRSGTSGTWGGVLFNSGSSGSLTYSTISNCGTAIKCESVLPTIQNNITSTNTFGIWLNNVNSMSVPLKGNDISGSTSMGIYCNNSSVRIDSNNIHDNTGPYGIFGVSTSSYIYKNRIKNNVIGIYLTGNTNAKLYNYDNGNGKNYINGNTSHGLSVDNPGIVAARANDIFGNGGYEIRANGSGVVVQASYNYYGMYPPIAGEFSATNGAYIFYSPGSSTRYSDYLSKEGALPEEADTTINKGTITSIGTIPTEDKLCENYPNPFNPSTMIEYHLKDIGYVTLKVYDVMGRELVTLVDGTKEAGFYKATFDGSKFSSGMYFTRMTLLPQEGSPAVFVKKMLLLK